VIPEHTFLIVVQLVVLLFAVSFHESAHGFVAMKCGDNTARDLGRITLNPLKHLDPLGSLFIPMMLAISGLPIFGWAKPVPVSLRDVRNPRRANLLVSAAGPVSNLILAVASAAVLLILGPVQDHKSVAFAVAQIAFASFLVNIALAVFNLLPLPPLDGFGVLESLLPARLLRVTMWLRRFGFIILIVLMMSGFLSPLLISANRFFQRLLLGGLL